jgi:hypothetical protein
MSREAMQLALEALEKQHNWMVANGGMFADSSLKAISALRQALEEKLKPVFWSVATGWVYANDISQERVDETVKREHEWIGLTDDEIEDIYFDKFSMSELVGFARSIEQALKEKNKL